MARSILERVKRLEKAVPDNDFFTIELMTGTKTTIHAEKLLDIAMKIKYSNENTPASDEIKAIYYPKAQESFVRLLKDLMVLDADSEEMPYLIEQKIYD